MTTATRGLNYHSAGSSRVLGAALVILSTVAIAIVPSFARLAYDGGSNTLTVITARSILTVLLTFVVIRLCRRALRIDRKPLFLCTVAGICYAVMLCGFLGAVELIPVNTVILIYFVHPVIVGLVAARLGDEAISRKMILALLAALGGLALAVGASLGQLNVTGIALAALAMVTCVLVILGSGRASKQASGLIVVFYTMLWAAITLTILFMFFGELRLPVTGAGWLGFGGVAICSTIGTLAFFCAVPLIGAVRATMISNVEPLLGILFAVILLGETISGFQMAGIAMVLVSIIAMELKWRAD
jgi:drug/metabolite transporter (DMT)-like permease